MPEVGDWEWAAGSTIERWSFAAAAAAGRDLAWSDSRSIASAPNPSSPILGTSTWILWRRNPDSNTTLRAPPHEPLANQIRTGQLQHRRSRGGAQTDHGLGRSAQFSGAQHAAGLYEKGRFGVFYPPRCDGPGIAGIVSIAKEGYPDKTAFDRKHHHYDADSKEDAPRWFVVDVKLVRKLE